VGLGHEIGHCKLRDAFLNRADGHVADASVFPWLAQERRPMRMESLSSSANWADKAPVRQR